MQFSTDLIATGSDCSFVSSLSGTNANTLHKITMPNRKWTAEPAAMTMVRFHTG